MYLKKVSINIMKVMNALFNVIGIFQIAMGACLIISLFAYYEDDYETIMTAKSMPGSINMFVIGVILVFVAGILKRIVEEANFYSSYFEGDLDGYITYSDLADITGKNILFVKLQLAFFRVLCMKNYDFYKINGVDQVVLKSKKYLCECKSCGAAIEKSVYFTGTCSYCESSDLFAKVISDNRFYCIDKSVSCGVNKPNYYTSSSLTGKCVLYIFLESVGIGAALIMTILFIDNILKYNDQDYLVEVLLSGESYSSFRLIKKEILKMIIFDGALLLAILPGVFNNGRKLHYIGVANKCSRFFSKFKRPFVKFNELYSKTGGIGRKGRLKAVRGALRRRYLVNCTLEKHDGVLVVALAKQIVKDRCPSCGGSIVGAVDEHYRCRYCDNLIMDVVRKK